MTELIENEKSQSNSNSSGPEIVYMDYNATTPLEESVLQAIHDALKDAWGNPSSAHFAGKKASSIIKTARKSIADMIRGSESDIVFTSGGTESNNAVINTSLKYFLEMVKNLPDNNELKGQVPHIITTNLEHDSVQLPVVHLTNIGEVESTFVSVSKDSGMVTASEIIRAVQPNTCLVSVMMANNETGIIQPIAEIVKAFKCLNEKRERDNLPRILLHTDAAQTIGKIKMDVEELGIDYLTVVGHKFYGPRIGALYIRGLGEMNPLYPMFYGGGQERNFRPGTENTGMIAGLGQAAQLVVDNLQKYYMHMKQVRDYLEAQLIETFGDQVHFNGRFCGKSERIPNTCNVSIKGKGLQGRTVLASTKHLQASVGAACHSSNVSCASPILLALGIPNDIAINAIRLSIGRETTWSDVDTIVRDLKQTVDLLHQHMNGESHLN